MDAELYHYRWSQGQATLSPVVSVLSVFVKNKKPDTSAEVTCIADDYALVRCEVNIGSTQHKERSSLVQCHKCWKYDQPWYDLR